MPPLGVKKGASTTRGACYNRTMGIFNTFTKRRRARENGGSSDVFTYDELSMPFRIQVVHIWLDTIGDNHADGYSSSTIRWRELHKAYVQELGRFTLLERPKSHGQDFTDYFINVATTDEALDAIDMAFAHLDHWARYGEILAHVNAEAVAHLNARFLEHGLGYEYNQELIRKDSQFLHSEVVSPSLGLLGNDRAYSGADDEFRKAFEHYRHGRNKEAIVEACKSFESTMKVICTKRKWPFDPQRASASDLIKIIFVNELIPPFLQTSLPSIKTLLESGLPTVRNKTGGHGQGVDVIEVPQHLVSYALHQAACNIKLLVTAERAMQ